MPRRVDRVRPDGATAHRCGRWILLAAAISMAACGEPPPREEILRPVRTQTVYATGGSRVRVFSGVARAGQETELSFRVPGTVDRLDARVGETVKAGAVIARLESRDYELQVQKAQAGLDQARAARRSADANLDRIRGLWENGNASQNDLDGARAQAESAAAQVESAEKSVEVARRHEEYTRLVVPVDGAIASVDVEVNENVRQGQTVVVMTSGSRPEVELAMPELLVPQVREGQPVTVRFDALPGDSFDAVVTEVGVASTGTATTFPVTVRLTREVREVRSGMAAEVSFRFQETRHGERYYLPAEAVGEDRDGRFVFVLEPAEESGVGRVRRTSVEVGDLTPDGLEVRSGLQEGARVVTAGVRRLADGQRVRLLEAGEAP